jgi:hypothetical protein
MDGTPLTDEINTKRISLIVIIKKYQNPNKN